MAHVLTEACIRCKYTDCVSMCPVETHPAQPATAPWHARSPPALACRYTARTRTREAKGDTSWPSPLPSRR